MQSTDIIKKDYPFFFDFLNSLKKLFIRDNRLVGFELVGQTERAGIYMSQLRNGTPLDSLDFERLKKVPDLSAFRAENRRKMLRGMV